MIRKKKKKEKCFMLYIHKYECVDFKFTQNITTKKSEKSEQEISKKNIIEIN